MYCEQYVLNLSLRLLDAADHIIIEWYVGLAVSDHTLPFRATMSIVIDAVSVRPPKPSQLYTQLEAQCDLHVLAL